MTKYTIRDILNTIDRKGNATKVAEILSKSNPILKDAPWMEANETFGYKFSLRTSLPKGEWRSINTGVSNETSSTLAVTEAMGMLEIYSDIDKALVDNHPQPEFFRMLNANAFIEGMGQTMAQGIIYGNNRTNPNSITGLATRLNSSRKKNVYSCEGQGIAKELTSVYIVQWATDKTFLFHPKKHKTKGIEHQDLGEVTLTDKDGKMYQGYRDHFKVHCGLGTMDERSIARICNIDTSKKANETQGGFKEDILIEALNKFPMDAQDTVIYISRKVKTIMEIAMKNKNNINFSMDYGMGGVPLMRFRGVPVRILDAISDQEAYVPIDIT